MKICQLANEKILKEIKVIKMKNLVIIILSCILFTACNGSKKAQNNMKPIELFKQIIVGDFDNNKQVADEIAAGKQIHPIAKHVNRIANSKIKNLPQDANSFFVLEESYYTYPNKPMDIKPYLFKFSAGENNTVVLSVYQLPASIDKKDIRNDNENLLFDFNELKLSPTFKGATYRFINPEKTFTTNAVNDLGNGMKFTLTEILTKEKLIVMELLEKEGKRLTPYETPIIYDRK
jgi:uncharacterized lipoprotein YajG